MDSTADESATQTRATSVYKRITASIPPPIELVANNQYSLIPDMACGWRPANIVGAPIPLYFNHEKVIIPINPETKIERPIYY